MMIRELNEMQRMAGASALALELQTKKNQQLLSQLHTAEAQIKRLLDLQEQTQAQRDAAQAELNKALAVVDAARAMVGKLDKEDVCHYPLLILYYEDLYAALAAYDAARGAK